MGDKTDTDYAKVYDDKKQLAWGDLGEIDDDSYEGDPVRSAYILIY